MNHKKSILLRSFICVSLLGAQAFFVACENAGTDDSDQLDGGGNQPGAGGGNRPGPGTGTGTGPGTGGGPASVGGTLNPTQPGTFNSTINTKTNYTITLTKSDPSSTITGFAAVIPSAALADGIGFDTTTVPPDSAPDCQKNKFSSNNTCAIYFSFLPTTQLSGKSFNLTFSYTINGTLKSGVVAVNYSSASVTTNDIATFNLPKSISAIASFITTPVNVTFKLANSSATAKKFYVKWDAPDKTSFAQPVADSSTCPNTSDTAKDLDAVNGCTLYLAFQPTSEIKTANTLTLTYNYQAQDGTQKTLSQTISYSALPAPQVQAPAQQVAMKSAKATSSDDNFFPFAPSGSTKLAASSVAFSNDGSYLAVGALANGNAKNGGFGTKLYKKDANGKYNYSAQTPVQVFTPAGNESVQAMAFSPDNTMLIMGNNTSRGTSGVIYVRDQGMKTFNNTVIITPYAKSSYTAFGSPSISTLAFSPAGDLLAIGTGSPDKNAAVKLFNSTSDNIFYTNRYINTGYYADGGCRSVGAVAFGSDSLQLAIGCRDINQQLATRIYSRSDTSKSFDPKIFTDKFASGDTQTPVSAMAFTNKISGPIKSSDPNQYLAIGSDTKIQNNSARIYKLINNSFNTQPYSPQNTDGYSNNGIIQAANASPISTMAFSPDNMYLAVGGTDGVAIYNNLDGLGFNQTRKQIGSNYINYNEFFKVPASNAYSVSFYLDTTVTPNLYYLAIGESTGARVYTWPVFTPIMN